MRRSIRLAALTAVVIITLTSCSAMRFPGRTGHARGSGCPT